MTNMIQFPGRESEFDRSEEEREAARAKLAERYAQQRAREEAARGDAREIAPEAFAARVEYQANKQQPTQNADGVRVGDLFYTSWGYEQTNVNFFQVVGLKGKHTAIIREIAKDYIGGFSYSGNVRPERGNFTGEEITARTRKCPYSQDDRPEVRDRRSERWMSQTTDDAEHGYSSYA